MREDETRTRLKRKQTPRTDRGWRLCLAVKAKSQLVLQKANSHQEALCFRDTKGDVRRTETHTAVRRTDKQRDPVQQRGLCSVATGQEGNPEQRGRVYTRLAHCSRADITQQCEQLHSNKEETLLPLTCLQYSRFECNQNWSNLVCWNFLQLQHTLFISRLELFVYIMVLPDSVQDQLEWKKEKNVAVL